MDTRNQDKYQVSGNRADLSTAAYTFLNQLYFRGKTVCGCNIENEIFYGKNWKTMIRCAFCIEKCFHKAFNKI